MVSVRAVYEQGHLRLLDPVDLKEGQEIHVTIMSDRERVRAALGDLLVETPITSDEDFDEEQLMQEIEEAFRGLPPLSEIIIQERREGP